MVSIHPACGFSLQRATQVLAVMGIFLSIGEYIVALIGIKSTIAQHKREEYEMMGNFTIVPTIGLHSSARAIYTGLYILVSVLVFCGVTLDVYLFFAAKKCNLKQCQGWFVFSTALWIVSVFQHTYSVIDEGYTPSNIAAVAYLVIDIYILWVVLEFIHEMEERARSDIEMEYTRNEIF